METNLLLAARACLAQPDPADKTAHTRKLAAAWDRGELDWEQPPSLAVLEQPGRPARPRLVAPNQLPRRRLSSNAGRAALIHAIVHIEFNALNLALDAIQRFPELPRRYYQDWVSVALDEARHFEMLCARLQNLGHRYGDFPAHDGLWETARRSAGDPLLRMALVPRVLEARGLDVTPGMIDRLIASGDLESVAVLRVILAEEVRHVAIGSRWFGYLCKQRGLDPQATFAQLVSIHFPRGVGGPLNRDARLRAGFSADELDALQRASEAAAPGRRR